MGPFQPQDKRRPALHPTQDAIDARGRAPASTGAPTGAPVPDDALTVPRAWIGEDGSIEVSSSMFIDEGAPPPGPDDPAASLVGQLVSGRYRVDAILGRGGLGAVYAGEQIHLHKRVAIKVLRPGTEQMPGLVERFEREAVAGAHVQHPNVAAAIDFGKLDNGAYFLVSEYVEGVPLSRVLAAGPLAPARALGIARQMADALAAVHAKGILHRDVKPQNTILGEGDRVKIIDFGLAKVDMVSATGRAPANGTVPLTGVGMIFGTIAYLAPEAEMGMGAVDARSDLYALGVTLYEMLCGQRPFSAPDRTSLFLLQRTQDPPPPHVRVPEVPVPAAAERVAMRLVQRRPADRYASAREAIDAIDEALRAIGGAPPGPAPQRTSTPGTIKMAASTPSTVKMAIVAPGPVAMPPSPYGPAEVPAASGVPKTLAEKVVAAPAPRVGAASLWARVPRVAIVIAALVVVAGLVVLGVMLVLGSDGDDDDPGPTQARTAGARTAPPARTATAPRPSRRGQPRGRAPSPSP